MSYSPSDVPFLPDPAAFPSSIKIPFIKLGRPTFSVGVNVTPTNLGLVVVNSDVALPSNNSQKGLFLPAACPMLYDGQRAHEAGFNYFPETEFSADGTGGQLVAGSTYSFIFVFEWIDKNGKVHRSAPSVAVSRTLAALKTSVVFKVSPQFLTDKQGADLDIGGTILYREAISIVCYRTAAGGTVYYRDTVRLSGAAQEINRMSSVATMDVGESSDAQLITSELLYTTGGALENQAYSSCDVSCAHQRRVFTASGNTLRYTEEDDDESLAISTNESYELPAPTDGGSITGLAVLDDKLIVFCQSKIYFVFGTGPNRLGQQNGYSLPQECVSSMGLLGGFHDSIAATPDGLWFMSSSGGLRLLTKGLAIAENQNGQIGREADGYFEAAFTNARACIDPSRKQVRWYVAGPNTVVVWDYQQGQWSQFTNHDSYGGATCARGVFWHSNGTALYASNAAAGGLDVAANVPQTIETAWIALADVQGFQRVYKMLLLAQAMGVCIVDIAVGYNYDPAWISSVTVGSSVTAFRYVVAAAANPLQLEHAMHIQQCEAVRFRLTITPTVSLGTLLNGANLPWDNGNGGSTSVGNNVSGNNPGGVPFVGSGASSVAFTTPAAATGNMGVTLASGIAASDYLDNCELFTDDDTWEGVVNRHAGGQPVVFVNTLPVVGAVITSASAQATVASFITYTTGARLYGIVTSGQVGTFVDGETLYMDRGATEAIRLTALQLSVGLKKGAFKLASSKRF